MPGTTPPDNIPDVSSVIVHTVASSSIIATILGYLPAVLGVVAAFLASVYYSICVWESRTIQHWMNNRRMVRRARRLMRLKAKEKVLTAKIDALQIIKTARKEARAKVEDATAEAAKLIASTEPKIQEKVPPI